MSRKEFIVGLDIGTTKTCCVVAEVDSQSSDVDIIGVGLCPSKGVRKGVVVDLEDTTDAIMTSVEKARNMCGNVLIKTVVVGVTGEHISSLNSKGVIAITNPDKEISSSDVDRVIDASKVIVLPPDREIIHSIPRDYIVDGQDGVRDPVGMSGARLEVETHLVTGSVTFLDNVLKCVQRANLAVDMTVFEPIATSEAALIQAEKELGVALVDIGGGTTDIAVFTDGEVIYTAVIAVGGNHVTNDISVGLRTSYEESERVKIEYGYCMPGLSSDDATFEVMSLGADEPRELPCQILFDIIEPRMQEILSMAKEEIIKSGCIEILPGGVVLTGGGSQIPGAISMAEDIFQMPARL
ncbi:MAG: cell division protein FtsA, partial [Armatimonadota bacterium]